MNETNKKKPLILIGILALAVIAIVIAVVMSQSGKQVGTNTGANTPGKNKNADVATTTEDASTVVEEVKVAPVTATQPLKDVKIVVAGANPITADNKVVTPEGVKTDNNAAPMSPTAPKQTGFLEKKDLPAGMTNLTVSAAGFSPKEFTTKVGAPTSISITSGDSGVHVFTFQDASLSAVAVLVGPGQTKAIVFNAPDKAGEYTFSCASPDHASRGETGKMIVK